MGTSSCALERTESVQVQAGAVAALRHVRSGRGGDDQTDRKGQEAALALGELRPVRGPGCSAALTTCRGGCWESHLPWAARRPCVRAGTSEGGYAEGWGVLGVGFPASGSARSRGPAGHRDALRWPLPPLPPRGPAGSGSSAPSLSRGGPGTSTQLAVTFSAEVTGSFSVFETLSLPGGMGLAWARFFSCLKPFKKLSLYAFQRKLSASPFSP